MRKKENKIPEISTVGAEDSSYIINGLSNKTIGRVDGTFTQLELVYQNGDQENIELSASELPEGMEIIFEPKSGIPGFNTTMHIESSLTKAGIYPVKIHGVSKSGKVKTYTFDVTVRDNFHCDSLLMQNIGVFATRNQPRGDTVFNQTYLQSSTSNTEYPVYFLYNLYLETIEGRRVLTGNNGQYPSSNSVMFVFDCADHSFSLPEVILPVYNPIKRKTEYYTVSGEGGEINFKTKTVTIIYQVKTPSAALWYYKLETNLRLSYL